MECLLEDEMALTPELLLISIVVLFGLLTFFFGLSLGILLEKSKEK